MNGWLYFTALVAMFTAVGVAWSGNDEGNPSFGCRVIISFVLALVFTIIIGGGRLLQTPP